MGDRTMALRFPDKALGWFAEAALTQSITSHLAGYQNAYRSRHLAYR